MQKAEFLCDRISVFDSEGLCRLPVVSRNLEFQAITRFEVCFQVRHCGCDTVVEICEDI